MSPKFRYLLPHLWKIYIPGIAVAVGLFAIHSLVIYQTFSLLTFHSQKVNQILGPSVSGPVLIVSCFLILFITHLGEAALWVLFFLRSGQFANFGEGLYFVGTSITALGYGDIVLRAPWRGMGPVMAINGILMFGCSTAFLFLVIEHIWKM